MKRFGSLFLHVFINMSLHWNWSRRKDLILTTLSCIYSLLAPVAGACGCHAGGSWLQSQWFIFVSISALLIPYCLACWHCLSENIRLMQLLIQLQLLFFVLVLANWRVTFKHRIHFIILICYLKPMAHTWQNVGVAWKAKHLLNI